MKYQFRAECLLDVNNFLDQLEFEPKYWISPIGQCPDVEVKIELDLTLEEIKDIMRDVEDSHVMIQTIMPVEQYTGERNFDMQ